MTVPSEPPRRYLQYGEAIQAFTERDEQARAEHEGDIVFAHTAGTIFTEGPWDGAEREVAYVGFRQGKRFRLDQICRMWRYEPPKVLLNRERGGGRPTYFIPRGPIAVRIELGRDLPGAIVRRPYGNAPVQSDGVVDGQDFYFRSRGDLWQMHIGGDDLVGSPSWFYQEDYGTWPEAGMISADQAEDFIEKAFALYRSGLPSMVKERPDFQSGLIKP